MALGVSGEQLTFYLKKGRNPKGARAKGMHPCSLYISDVKNKLYLHPGGGGVQSAWCCVGCCVGERAGPPLCYSAPELEREADGHLLLASTLCAGKLHNALLQPKRNVLPS